MKITYYPLESFKNVSRPRRNTLATRKSQRLTEDYIFTHENTFTAYKAYLFHSQNISKYIHRPMERAISSFLGLALIMNQKSQVYIS